MDIYSYLKKDHRVVEELMDKLLGTQDIGQRQRLFLQIKEELSVHADTEEVTFYKAIEDATRSKKVHEKMKNADEEHDEIREYLSKLEELQIDSETWMEQFGEFKHAVAHHVEEEEDEVFEKAKKYLSKEEAIKLAKDMEKLKKQRRSQMAA